ncbi:MAG: sulfotransferase [Chloroflexi bacterium]|nr:sulfotransferase [Chloroflexota bacterium]
MTASATGTPIFVGVETSSYSGATLLAFLLNAHPSITSIGELNGLIPSEDPESYLCSCGKKIKDCDFWQSVSCEMKRRGFEFNVADFRTAFRLSGQVWLQRLRAGSFRNAKLDAIRDWLLQKLPQERRQFKALAARNLALIESILMLTGKRVFVDTSKDHLRVRALQMFSPYDVRVIHLVRDPRGVVASRLRRGVPIDAEQAARQWVRLHMRLQNLHGNSLADKYIRIRYEDLCQNPRAVLKQLYTFCGVDSDFEIADWQAMPHHIVGNVMRLANVDAIKLDERWRSLLTETQKKDIWQIAGRLSEQYGYCAQA